MVPSEEKRRPAGETDGAPEIHHQQYRTPVAAKLHQEQGRLLAELHRAHAQGAPAMELRRLSEEFLRLTWIQDLAEAEEVGLEPRVSLLELRIRDLYRRLPRRGAA